MKLPIFYFLINGSDKKMLEYNRLLKIRKFYYNKKKVWTISTRCKEIGFKFWYIRLYNIVYYVRTGVKCTVINDR